MDSVDMKLYPGCLLQALVTPLLDFGAAVWGMERVQTRSAFQGIETMQLKFLKDCVGIRRSTAKAVVYREMRMCSVWAGWTRRVAGLWNKVVRCDPSDMARFAVAESCSMAEGGAEGVRQRSSATASSASLLAWARSGSWTSRAWRRRRPCRQCRQCRRALCRAEQRNGGG